MDVAEASFRISIDSISCDERSLNSLMIPSTTTNGDPGLLIEAPPRSMINGVAPGEPEALTTCRPDTVPWSAVPTFALGAEANTWASSLLMALVTFLLD